MKELIPNPLNIVIFLSISIILFSISHALTEQKKDQILLDHISWITENSYLEYNGESLPEIRKITRSEMIKRFYNIDLKKTKYTAREKYILENSTIAALYQPSKNIMYFQPEFSIKNWKTTHILVHELVHFLQMTNGVHAQSECKPKLEVFAYKLQSKWQKIHDHPAPPPKKSTLTTLSKMCS